MPPPSARRAAGTAPGSPEGRGPGAPPEDPREGWDGGMIDTGSPAAVGRLSTHGPGEVDGAQWQHHRFLQVHSYLCQLLLHLLRIQPLLHGVGVCWKHQRVEGPCISPLVPPSEGAMVTAHAHGRSMGNSHHWARMDPKILGAQVTSWVSPSGDGPRGGGFVDTSSAVSPGSHLGCARAPRCRWGH